MNESEEAGAIFAWSAESRDARHDYKRVGFIGISNWALDPGENQSRHSRCVCRVALQFAE